MKAMNIDAVANFPFPTPPEMHALKKAETALTRLGALINPPVLSSSATPLGVATVTIGGSITPLGRSMSLFPLAPRHARMLVVGQQHGCLPYVIAIVSILSVGDPFLREEGLADAEKSDEDEDELEHIKSERIKAKEAQRTRRRAFFEKQQVCSVIARFDDILMYRYHRSMLQWATQRATSFECFQLWVLTSMQVEDSSSATNTLSDPRLQIRVSSMLRR